jgi:hypothetical protein
VDITKVTGGLINAYGVLQTQINPNGLVIISKLLDSHAVTIFVYQRL